MHPEKDNETKYMPAGLSGFSFELAEEGEEISAEGIAAEEIAEEAFGDGVNGAVRFWPACVRIPYFKVC